MTKTWLCAIASVLMLMTLQAGANEKLYLYTEPLPPYSMTTDGRPFAHSADDIAGLCPDIVKAIADEAGVNYKMKLRNWSYGLSKVQRSKNNGIFCATRNEQRENSFKWVGPLIDIQWTLFAKPGSDITLNDLEDARDYVIGGYKDDVMTSFLVEQGFNVSIVTDNALNPSRLMLGKIDLWVADRLDGPFTASDAADISDLKVVLSFRTTPMYLAMNLDTPDSTINKLQQALSNVRERGVIDALEQNYGL